MTFVRDAMTKNPTVVRSNASLIEAANEMRSIDAGPLPIEENNRIIGIVTDRDIVVRGIADGKDPRNTKVRDVMTTSVVHVYEDQKIEEAAKLMEQNQIRRLLVFDHKERLVGILSQADLSAVNPKLTGDVVAQVSKPT